MKSIVPGDEARALSCLLSTGTSIWERGGAELLQIYNRSERGSHEIDGADRGGEGTLFPCLYGRIDLKERGTTGSSIWKRKGADQLQIYIRSDCGLHEVDGSERG